MVRFISRTRLYATERSQWPLNHCRLYVRLASLSALAQPTRLPRASSRLARARAALNVVCARESARATDAGVGWRSSWAPIDCRPVGPASGLFADCRTACSNCAIALLQGPACADTMLRSETATTTAAATFTRHLPFKREVVRQPALT